MQKKPIIALAVVALGAAALFGQLAHAQNAAPQPDRMHSRLERIAQQLNLTPQQRSQEEAVYQQARQQAQAIRANTSLTTDQKQEQRLALFQATKQQALALLTPTQQQQAIELVSRHAHQGMERVAERLELTADQKAQIKTIFADAKTQAETIRQDTSQTPDQKRAGLRSLFQATKQQALGVLTPAQQQQWAAMQAQRRLRHTENAQ